MKKETAEEINRILLSCRGALAGVADLARDGSDPDEAKAYRREERDAVEAELRRQGSKQR